MRRVCWTAESWIHDKQCGFILVLSIAPILLVFEDVWLCAVRVVLGAQRPVVTGHSCTNSQRGWSIMVVISGIRAAGRSGAPSANDEQKAHQRPERFAVSFISVPVPVGQTFLRQGKWGWSPQVVCNPSFLFLSFSYQGHCEAGPYLSHLRGRGRPWRGRQIWQGEHRETENPSHLWAVNLSPLSTRLWTVTGRRSIWREPKQTWREHANSKLCNVYNKSEILQPLVSPCAPWTAQSLLIGQWNAARRARVASMMFPGDVIVLILAYPYSINYKLEFSLTCCVRCFELPDWLNFSGLTNV